MAAKRHAADSDDFAAGSAKRGRVGEDDLHDGNSTELVTVDKSSSALIVKDSISSELAPNRTSHLQAPTMMLSGHSGPVFTMSFSSSGESIASAGMDTNICKFAYTVLECLTVAANDDVFMQFYGTFTVNAEITMSCKDIRTRCSKLNGTQIIRSCRRRLTRA
jgi:WD40 repeat protein